MVVNLDQFDVQSKSNSNRDRIIKTTRRKALRAFGVTGAGIVGSQFGIKGTRAASSDGVPIVHTYDIYGEPDKIRLISKERYRRINSIDKVAEALEGHHWFNGATLQPLSDDPDDLAVEVFYENYNSVDEFVVERLAKSAVQDIPVVVTGEKTNPEDDYCSPRHDPYDELTGGISIHHDPDSTSYGTLTTGAFGPDGEPLLLTNEHVMEGNPNMYQPASGGDKVGSYYKDDVSEDMAAYEASDAGAVDYRGVEELNDLRGTWDFYGLADEIFNNGPVQCNISGANSCTVTNEAVDTRRGGVRAYHEVQMGERNAGGGDSGGPWVDDDGYLVAVHNGKVNSTTDAGAAGRQALNSVDAQLYYQQ